jgi:acyl-CoA hydrolase
VEQLAVIVAATVDHVVTEYGVARLRGQSIAERARRLIAIAATCLLR